MRKFAVAIRGRCSLCILLLSEPVTLALSQAHALLSSDVFVTCVDKDGDKIESLKKGIIPFYEPGLEELVSRNYKQGRIKFTTEISGAIEESLVIFIAVGTPPRGDGSADLSYVDEVAREIANHIKSYKVVVTKSTVPVGTGERLRRIISETLINKIGASSINFDIVSNPEFLREGAAIEDFMRPNRVVLGADSQQAIAILKDLYRPLYLIETPFVIANIENSRTHKICVKLLSRRKDILYQRDCEPLRKGWGQCKYGRQRHGLGWRVSDQNSSMRVRASGGPAFPKTQRPFSKSHLSAEWNSA